MHEDALSGLGVRHRVLRSKGRYLDLSSPQIMAIMNLSMDSFYSGSIASDIKSFSSRLMCAVSEGATIIDIGAASSKPGSKILSPKEEINRIEPFLEIISNHDNDCFFSVDTIHAEVADFCLNHGFDIINDISAGQHDAEIIDVAAEHQVPYVAMHMQGIPENMQDRPTYIDVTKEVIEFFVDRLRFFHIKGLYDVILDPGFGFGKTISHNFQLMKELDLFKVFDEPLLVGVSRKSFIYKTLDVTPDEALNGTTAMHMEALKGGASILRVHDVKEAMQTLRLHAELYT